MLVVINSRDLYTVNHANPATVSPKFHIVTVYSTYRAAVFEFQWGIWASAPWPGCDSSTSVSVDYVHLHSFTSVAPGSGP